MIIQKFDCFCAQYVYTAANQDAVELKESFRGAALLASSEEHHSHSQNLKGEKWAPRLMG